MTTEVEDTEETGMGGELRDTSSLIGSRSLTKIRARRFPAVFCASSLSCEITGHFLSYILFCCSCLAFFFRIDFLMALKIFFKIVKTSKSTFKPISTAMKYMK